MITENLKALNLKDGNLRDIYSSIFEILFR